MIVQHEYTSKPSIVTLRAALRKAVAQGADFIQLTWGENQITVELTEHGWHGSGWIGKNGGDDLARGVKLLPIEIKSPNGFFFKSKIMI